MNHKGLLIYAPSQLLPQEIPKPDSSIGLLYLAAALEKNGISTDILDANIGHGTNLKDTLFRFIPQENGLIKIGMSFDEISNYIYNGNYTFIGLTSNFTSQTHMVIETAKAIKNINNIKIYAGGTNARVLKEKFLNSGYFDGVCLTDGELIFPQMILNGIENTSGWAYLKNNKIIVNEINETCFPKYLDDLPMPAWSKLSNEKYVTRSIINPKMEFSSPLLTSRGCRFHCAYCHISGKKKDVGKLRLHSLNRVIDEIRELKKLGIKHIYLEDDSLLSMKTRSKELLKLIQNEEVILMGMNGINLIDFFDTTKEINGKWLIDIELIEILYNAGFRQMAFPVESGSQRIINKYCSGKIKLDKMDIIKLMKIMNEVGIKSAVNLIIGFPDETEDEIQQTIEIGLKLKNAGSLYTTIFFATPYPGTKLYEMCLKEGYLDNDLNTDIFNWKTPIMKNTIVSPEKLIEIQSKMNEECNDKEFIFNMESKTIGKLI